ncbi:hypothetical protein P2318_34505 [Myxococcaceae bacterium GXIMD 01537]
MKTPVVPRFEGGVGLMRAAGAVGAVGLGATALGALGDARAALFGYLFGFTYWLGLAVATVILVAVFHASKARWPVVLRRVLELTGATVPLFLVLFVPIALGMRALFPWVEPGPGVDAHTLELLRHKAPYLNVPFFLGRAFGYFAVWGGVAFLLLRYSRAQDAGGELRWTMLQRRLGGGALPALALTFSFMTLDWMLSLEPTASSTLYGLYVFAGAFAGSFALVIVVARRGRDGEHFGSLLNEGHFHRLGTFLFAFVCFWAYLAYSQYMLVWIATLPEELAWYRVRTRGLWGAVAVVLAVGHFAVPFFLLLSKRLKRSPGALAAVALWVLAMHAVDTAWLLLPALSPETFVLPWTCLTALVGVGGLAVALGLWLARGGYTVPVGDPFLYHSLQVRKP